MISPPKFTPGSTAIWIYSSAGVGVTASCLALIPIAYLRGLASHSFAAAVVTPTEWVTTVHGPTSVARSILARSGEDYVQVHLVRLCPGGCAKHLNLRRSCVRKRT